MRIHLDKREVGTFRNREYETLELPAGRHHLRAGLRSAGFVAWGWNEKRIHVGPGETVYIEISVRLVAREVPGGRDLEIPGRSMGVASENVFLQRRAADVARPHLDSTTRLEP